MQHAECNLLCCLNVTSAIAELTSYPVSRHLALCLSSRFSIIGGLDFCCRLGCGFLADLKILRVSTIICIGFSVLGVVCQFTRFLNTFPLLVALAVAQGLLGGVAACLLPILIMEDIGVQHTAKALGFHKLFSGAVMAAFHPLLGEWSFSLLPQTSLVKKKLIAYWLEHYPLWLKQSRLKYKAATQSVRYPYGAAYFACM